MCAADTVDDAVIPAYEVSAESAMAGSTGNIQKRKHI